MTDTLPPLAAQPADTAWPTDTWPTAPIPDTCDTARFTALLDAAFADPAPGATGETHAFVAVQKGRLVSERYWKDYKATDTYPSWSKAKSITHALIGILVRDGKLDIHAPADVPEWQGADDPRRHITLNDLLHMSSGLEFTEDYVDSGVSDVIEMLFGKGKEDVAAFAAAFPLIHPPATYFSYASGTTNIIARIAARALGKTDDDFAAFMRAELFAPLGMSSAQPKFDPAGTFIGSSFCYCTAQDFARFALLYARDGVWNGQRILPEGWVDYARTPTPTPEDEPLGYGAHWWLGMCGEGSFSANGYQGQYTVIVPDKDLILIRHGVSNLDAQLEGVRGWLADIADCFDAN